MHKMSHNCVTIDINIARSGITPQPTPDKHNTRTQRIRFTASTTFRTHEQRADTLVWVHEQRADTLVWVHEQRAHTLVWLHEQRADTLIWLHEQRADMLVGYRLYMQQDMYDNITQHNDRLCII